MINPQWLQLPMSHTLFHGPKDDMSVEVRHVVDIHQKHLAEVLLMSTLNICFCGEIRKEFDHFD